MNRSPDVELVLRDYFANDSAPAPDHVLDVIEERIMRQPQQRAWRLDWRRYTMNTNVKLAAAAAAVLVVAVIGYNLLPGRSTGVGGPGPTPIPSPLVFVGDEPLTLAPGTYRLDDVIPGLTMTFDQGITLSRLDGQTISWGSGFRGEVSTIFDPRIVSWGPACEPRAPEAPGHTMRDLVADLTTRQGLQATRPTAIVIGGLSGEWFDLKVGKDLPASCLAANSAGNLPLLTTLHIDTGDGLRLFVLDDGRGSSVVIAFNSHGSITTVESVAAEALPVIDTYEFDVTP
jgi:hypothetical protein